MLRSYLHFTYNRFSKKSDNWAWCHGPVVTGAREAEQGSKLRRSDYTKQ